MVHSVTFRVFYLLIFCYCTRGEEDFWGCGGFIQVDRKTSLDLSKVEIRLYTKQGNLKYHTDCAPNNGYYFIPIYDKGDYVIKVISPDGWSFEPSTVSLSIDKVNDQCSQGKDINFAFKGFTINGKVLSHGNTDGPSGVTVQLLSDGAPLQTTTSETQGLFSFQNVVPGLYTVKASHPKWRFSSDQLQVLVESDSVTIGEGLEVQGYDVQGFVTSDGEPIQGVLFSLYSQSESATNCGLEPVGEASIDGGWKLICETHSDLKGNFLFPVVPPGQYKMIPVYRGENIQFDIRPAVVDVDVRDSSHVVAQKFEVEGFRVSGRVLEKPQGQGLVGAKIYLNGKLVATSGQEGHYNLENIKTGSYHLTAEAEKMDFDRLTVRISPNNPSLPDIVAAAYQVCGQINLSDLPATLANKGRQAIFIPIGDSASSLEPALVKTDDSGSFCSLLKPGSYKLEPMAMETEVEAGLKFVPSFREVTVGHAPLSGFSFTQFRASVRGRVQVVGANQEVSVQLSGSPGRAAQTVTTSDGAFEFNRVLPGKYTIRVQQEAWCWRAKAIEVEVVDGDIGPIEFEQLGFFFTVTVSHDLDLSYAVNSQVPASLSLKSGTSKHCLEGAGTYKFTPISCHTFEPQSVEWSTSEPSVVNFKATHHRTGLAIQSDHRIEDLEVSATSSSGDVLELSPEPVEEEKPSQFVHRFVFDARDGDTYQVEPRASALLFFPSKLTLQIGNRCDERAGVIIAQKGLYLTGFIHPAIEGVEITITSDTLGEPVVVSSDASGSYTFGPVNKDGRQPVVDLESTFRISAQKKGYMFQKSASRYGDFVAEKLAEISVVVSDALSGDPLAGVLVAAAGGVGYRQNSLTGSDGRVTLSELNPGDYFIKPVLKEYRFDPISKLVHIDDGATVELPVRGERVAFSCYGTVTALNAEPESLVTIEAVGVGPSCAEYQEESSSETNGQFRIRGLLPQCEYIVRLKNGNGGSNNKNIQRTLPANLPVKVGNSDVTGLRFVAIKSINQADVVVSVAVEQRDHLKTLKLKLYRQDQPDEVVHSIKLDQSPLVVLPPLPMDGKRYYIQLESNLGRSIYDFQTQEASFTANVSAQQVRMEFSPKRKTVDGDTIQVSVRGILLALLCGVAGYNYQTLGPVLQKSLSVVSAALRSGRESGAGSAPSAGSSREPVFSEQELALFAESNATKKKAKPRRA